MNNAIALLSLMFFSYQSDALARQNNVRVNGQAVTQQQFVEEMGRFGVVVTYAVPEGHYWYDQVAGLWGMVGGPTLGQLPPGLKMGGELRSDASGGMTTVYINGRALHPQEVVYLKAVFGYVIPGRYWMNAIGVGGPEGGPAMFNLAAAGQAQANGSGYNRRGLFGSTGSDGNCSYYMHPNGSSVMSGAC